MRHHLRLEQQRIYTKSPYTCRMQRFLTGLRSISARLLPRWFRRDKATRAVLRSAFLLDCKTARYNLRSEIAKPHLLSARGINEFEKMVKRLKALKEEDEHFLAKRVLDNAKRTYNEYTRSDYYKIK